MRRRRQVDGWVVGLFGVFILFGWLNIYAASAKDASLSIFNLEYNYGKQFIFLLIAAAVAGIVLLLDTKLTEFISYGVYFLTLLGLILVLLVGREVNGARGWLDLGPFKLQPAEFAKIGVVMALARYMSRYSFSLKRAKDRLVVAAIVGLPVALVLLQPDTGSALVYLSLVLMLYREGLSPMVLVGGVLFLAVGVSALLLPQYYVLTAIAVGGLFSWYYLYRKRAWLAHLFMVLVFSGFALSVDYGMQHVLKPHQQKRIVALFNPNSDPHGAGYNVIQSKIAVGSGGVLGKGFLQGTQTKFDFVPMQDTDFIFCTIGEEYGWMGSSTLLVLFFVLMARMLILSENTRTRYGRVLGYSVASIFFFHILVNVGMVLGLSPVIGIPLPFFSYGGSSLITFTILLFLLLNHHANHVNVLASERTRY